MKNLAYLFIFSALCAFTAPAVAADPLKFDGKIGQASRLALSHYLQASQQKTADDMLIAAADLNEDGLDEFIIRDRSCDSRTQNCNFKILSETGNTITVLGDIPARTIALGNAYSQGVRDLLAYESVINDYEYAVYVWEPREARYMMQGQK